MASKRKGVSPDIEKQIKELAQTDWEAFASLPGIDLAKIAICMQRKKGKSLQRIANVMKLPKSTVQDVCKKCTE